VLQTSQVIEPDGDILANIDRIVRDPERRNRCASGESKGILKGFDRSLFALDQSLRSATPLSLDADG
jgi:hypothetical protein